MEGKCEKCLYGTKMENGKCGGIFNCMEYDQNGFECKTCHKGHYLDKGKCHAIDGCRLTQHNGMCE